MRVNMKCNRKIKPELPQTGKENVRPEESREPVNTHTDYSGSEKCCHTPSSSFGMDILARDTPTGGKRPLTIEIADCGDETEMRNARYSKPLANARISLMNGRGMNRSRRSYSCAKRDTARRQRYYERKKATKPHSALKLAKALIEAPINFPIDVLTSIVFTHGISDEAVTSLAAEYSFALRTLFLWYSRVYFASDFSIAPIGLKEALVSEEGREEILVHLPHKERRRTRP
ncbi:hypothetical protein BZA77DRAFT_358042 [Pyronema omphalodes]|nr:hypothetical protein BZA77DRAFT_358042 [Pyronema omphalodes]